jgi:hypothetical protein
VRWLHEVLQESLLPLGPGAERLPADGLGVDMWDPRRAVMYEWRRHAVVAHHHRVGQLAAQRLDPDAVRRWPAGRSPVASLVRAALTAG